MSHHYPSAYGHHQPPQRNASVAAHHGGGPMPMPGIPNRSTSLPQPPAGYRPPLPPPPSHGYRPPPPPPPQGYPQPNTAATMASTLPPRYAVVPPLGSSPRPAGAGSFPTANSSGAGAEIDASKDKLISQLQSLVKEYPLDTLQALMDNEDRLMELVQDSQETKLLQKKRTELADGNKEQAVSNISLRPELEVATEELQKLIDVQNELKETLVASQSKLGGMRSTDDTSVLLQVAMSEKENETDTLASEFLDENTTIDDFLDRFLVERAVYHLRKVKSDKMAAIVRPNPNQANPPVASFRQPTGMPSLPAAGNGYTY